MVSDWVMPPTLRWYWTSRKCRAHAKEKCHVSNELLVNSWHIFLQKSELELVLIRPQDVQLLALGPTPALIALWSEPSHSCIEAFNRQCLKKWIERRQREDEPRHTKTRKKDETRRDETRERTGDTRRENQARWDVRSVGDETSREDRKGVNKKCSETRRQEEIIWEKRREEERTKWRRRYPEEGRRGERKQTKRGRLKKKRIHRTRGEKRYTEG